MKLQCLYAVLFYRYFFRPLFLTELTGRGTKGMTRRMMGDELLANEIAQKIKKKIQLHEFQEDSRLTVRMLCETFGVSETPVKQALNQLMAEGLVVAKPKCGMRVRKFDYRDLKNIWEARLMIEQYCARDAIMRVRSEPDFPEQVREIVRISDEDYEKCIREYTLENYIASNDHDRQFHLAIVESCSNDEIIRMYKSLNSHSGMYIGFERHTAETLRSVMTEHRQIMDSWLMCDLDGLKKALEDHIRSTIRIFSDQEGEADLS